VEFWEKRQLSAVTSSKSKNKCTRVHLLFIILLKEPHKSHIVFALSRLSVIRISEGEENFNHIVFALCFVNTFVASQ